MMDGVVRFEDRGARGRFISILTAEEAASRLAEKKSAAAAAN
jgi:hypothetical protein